MVTRNTIVKKQPHLRLPKRVVCLQLEVKLGFIYIIVRTVDFLRSLMSSLLIQNDLELLKEEFIWKKLCIRRTNVQLLYSMLKELCTSDERIQALQKVCIEYQKDHGLLFRLLELLKIASNDEIDSLYSWSLEDEDIDENTRWLIEFRLSKDN